MPPTATRCFMNVSTPSVLFAQWHHFPVDVAKKVEPLSGSNVHSRKVEIYEIRGEGGSRGGPVGTGVSRN